MKDELIFFEQRPGPDTHRTKSPFLPMTAPLRRLTITAKSTKVARLDFRMRCLGYNTLVKDMEGVRAKGKAVDYLIHISYNFGACLSS